MACGNSFSLALTSSGKAYYWGNFKYFGALSVKKDLEEPAIMAALENSETTDIAACYKYCVAVVGKGELRTWGKHLLDKVQGDKDESNPQAGKKEGDEGGGGKVAQVGKFPQAGRFSTMMESVHTGPNHTLAFSQNGRLFIWGHNNTNNRLGLGEPGREKAAKAEPLAVTQLVEELDKRRELAVAAKKTAPEKGEEGSEGGDESGGEEDDEGADESFEPLIAGESFEEPEQTANEPQEQIQPKKEKRSKKAEEKKGQSGEVGDITAEIIAQIGGHNSKQSRSKKGKKVK